MLKKSREGLTINNICVMSQEKNLLICTQIVYNMDYTYIHYTAFA